MEVFPETVQNSDGNEYSVKKEEGLIGRCLAQVFVVGCEV